MYIDWPMSHRFWLSIGNHVKIIADSTMNIEAIASLPIKLGAWCHDATFHTGKVYMDRAGLVTLN